jgi:hypothetical protein
MSAEDCPLAQLIEGLLWRKPTLKIQKLAAIYDPTQTLRYHFNLSQNPIFAVKLKRIFQAGNN